MVDDLDWDELMLYVRDGRVVPIVGNEFLQVQVNGRTCNMEAVLASELAGELGVSLDGLRLRISDVAFRYLQARGSAKRLYPKLKVLLDRRTFEPPEALRQLAEIREFPLVLTTSCSPLIRSVLDDTRHGGRGETEVLAFSPYSRPGDLPTHGPSASCVYHLFGLASSMPDYVITDEDLIEFLHSLQSDRRPQNLFDYLRGRHLLFLGCGYTNWLARFFIRTLRNERFASGNPQKSEVLVDDSTEDDQELTLFLRQYDSHVFRSLKTAAFVAELHRRYMAAPPAAPPTASGSHVRAMPTDAVFLSYAREDAAQVRTVAALLEHTGIDVWFDERRLVGGVEWDAMIQENIRRCSLFVPFISRNTEAVTESYFRAEWLLAIRRAMRMAPTRPFILPVGLDATPADAPNVPPEFRQWQWLRLGDGGSLDAIAHSVRMNLRIVRAPHYAAT